MSSPSTPEERRDNENKFVDQDDTANSADRALKFRLRRADFVLGALVLLLAFFLASFAIRNSEFWLHLASGRFLAQDLAQLGVDPFTYTSEGVLWVHHSWLYDLIVYHLYLWVGGPGLVICKGILISVMALLLLQIRLPGGSLWLTAVFAATALLAMSPSLMFGPQCVSLVFMALTAYLLFRVVHSPADDSLARRWWIVPALFVVWVNMDEWFVLGPILAFLFFLGTLLQRLSPDEDAEAIARQRQRIKIAGLILLAGVGACLMNPFGYRAFQLPLPLAYLLRSAGDFWPTYLVAAGSALVEMEQFEPELTQSFQFWQSPLVGPYWRQPFQPFNVVSLSYFLLLLIGLFSFLGVMVSDPTGEQKRGAILRFTVWAFFAALSLCMARFIVLFAVVAGPIAAMNCQVLFAVRESFDLSQQISKIWSWAGRGLTIAVLVVLLIYCWPGWLRGTVGAGNSAYRVRWAVIEDQGLRESAMQLAKLKEETKMHRCFNYSPHLAAYCAWFTAAADGAPAVQSFFDFRLALLAGKGEDFGQLRRAFQDRTVRVTKENVKGIVEARKASEQILKKYQISHVAFSRVMRSRNTEPIVEALLGGTRSWRLIYGDGNLVVFRHAKSVEPIAVGETAVDVDFAALAFGQAAVDDARIDEKMDFPEPRSEFANYLSPSKERSVEIDRARFYLRCHSALKNQRQLVHRSLFLWLPGTTGQRMVLGPPSQSVPAVGIWGLQTITCRAGAGAFAAPFTFGQSLFVLDIAMNEYGPPGVAILALRAARRAVRQNPNNPEAYRVLAQAYELLWLGEEKYWSRPIAEPVPTMRQRIRMVQWTAALKHLLVLAPDDFDTHFNLAQHYLLRLHYLDFALDHVERAAELLPKFQQRIPNETYQKLLERLNNTHAALAKEVPARRRYWKEKTSSLPLEQRVLTANHAPGELEPDLAELVNPKRFRRGLGLAKEALALIESSELSELPADDRHFLQSERLSILASTGQMKRMHNVLLKDGEARSLGRLGKEMTAQLAAAMGAYRLFDQEVAAIERRRLEMLSKVLPQKMLAMRETKFRNPAAFVGMLGLPGALSQTQHPVQSLCTAGARRLWVQALVDTKDFSIGGLAALRFVRGLIALEAGDNEKAAAMFQNVVRLVPPGSGFPDRAIAANYLRQIQSARKMQNGG